MSMTYDEAIAYIHGLYGTGEKRGLDNMRAMMARLGNPERAFRAVHVAGTNGKGSVCAFLQAALRCGGYRTGLYTSPFLQRYNERMRIDGAPIPDDVLARLAAKVRDVVTALGQEGIHPTEFEVGTALAFMYFAEEKVDIAVVEVGIGGRLDPTNIITPVISAIATIGLDHTKALGDTVELIAAEKAGIIKQGIPVAVSMQNEEETLEVIKRRCEELKSQFYIAKPTVGTTLGIAGDHQNFNAGVAKTVLDYLTASGLTQLTEVVIDEGLRRARWPGRLEQVAGNRPEVLLDGAHNEQGAGALARHIATLPRMKNVLVCGIMQDKDWRGIVEALAPLTDEAIAVAPDNKRALPAEALAEALRGQGVRAQTADSAEEALAVAMAAAGAEGRVIVAGSLYLVGEVRGMFPSLTMDLLAPE